jgi:hypothetical protein
MSTTKRKKAALAVIDDHPPITDLNNPALSAAIGIDHAITVIDDPYRDVKAHAVKIKGNWQGAVGSIIQTGHDLIEAKKDLPHGMWKKLFDKEIGNLPFGYDTAKRLMQIARHPVLSNEAYRPLLPPYWRTLSILSSKRVSETQLVGWLIDGTVTAETEQMDAIQLVNPPTLPAPSKHSYLAGLTGSEMAQAYTDLIKQHQLYEGACHLPWAQYFKYRDEHPDKYPLTNDDLAYGVQWWGSAGPAPVQQETKPKDDEVAAVQQLKDEVATRQLGNEEKIQKLRDDTAVLRLRNMDDSLCDAKVDWNKVIDTVGAGQVRDNLNELESHLNQYNKAKADHPAAPRLH